MFFPNIEEAKEIAKDYMLESVEDSKNWGRYSFLGFNPILEITCQDGNLSIKGMSSFSDCEIEDDEDKCFKVKTDNPGEYIREIVEENKSPKIEGMPPFSGGLVGYFSYDYIKYYASIFRRACRIFRL